MGCPICMIHWLVTYSSPWDVAFISKDGGCQLPSIKVAQGSKDRLDDLGQAFENKRLESRRKKSGHQPMGNLVGHTKDGRMERGAELMLPFPGQPSTALISKGNVPCGFESLEILVWLEEGAENDGIEEAKDEEQGEDILDLCRDNMPVRF